MQKIKIRLPATLTDFGPGFRSLGLAIGLYAQVEIAPREDEQLVVETEGAGAGHYALGLRHPVVLAMSQVFQRMEQAPLGITVRVKNDIPLNSGLGAESTFMTAGVVGANNLMGTPYSRSELVTLAAEISGRPDRAITTILGGLTASLIEEDGLHYRSLPLEAFKLILAVPEIEGYEAPQLDDEINTKHALTNMQRLPLLLEAFRQGDVRLLARMLDDALLGERMIQALKGYRHVAEVARLAGAIGVTSSGGGPAMVFLTERDHARIAEVIETAFGNLEIPVHVFVLPLDTQGIVISMMQTRI